MRIARWFFGSRARGRLSTALSLALWCVSQAAAEPPAVAKKPVAPAKVTAAPSEPVLELSAVLASFAKTEALSARFHEEKRMALLAQPMLSEGTLYYAKPRLLARHTDKPRKSSLLLRGETLSFGDKERSESIQLSAQPSLRVLVDTFVSVLGGDMAALTRVADVRAEALPNNGFRIRVLPKDEKVKRLVRSMSFEGQGALLTRMELLDANGDTTLTTFRDVTPRKAFSAAEQARLFKIGP